MIPTRKKPAFNFLLRRWMRRALRRRFHNVYLAGESHLEALDPHEPVIGCVNHTNWWDGFVLYALSARLLPHEVYLAMEEANLRRYPFLAWMGAFGVDLGSPQAALPGFRVALRLLRPSGTGVPNLVWMFVQGRLRRPAVPVEAKGGASALAKRARARLLPVALRYEWLGESRPSVFIGVGAPLPPDTAPDEIAHVLNRMLAEIDHSLDGSAPAGYNAWFAPGRSMNKRWDRFVHRLFRRPEAFDPQNNLPQ